MPQKHKPKRLEDMALLAVGDWINLIGRDFIECKAILRQRHLHQKEIKEWLVLVRETLFASVPWYLFDKVAEQVLTTVYELIHENPRSDKRRWKKRIFKNEMNVAVVLTEVALHPHIKQLNVSNVSTIMQHFLYKHVRRLTGIEDLDLGRGSRHLDTTKLEKYIMTALNYLTNLTTFCLCCNTTNHIISILGNNCPALQKLDVTSSRLVTDEGLPPLFNCKKLTEVLLDRTSVTAVGIKDLLLNLPEIQSLGRCEDFGRVLELLHERNSNPLSLKALQYYNYLSVEHLNLLVHYCPRLQSFSSSQYDQKIINLTILRKLQNLKRFDISGCSFFSDGLKQVLECIGYNLDVLYLQFIYEIDLNAVIYISQYCPNLKDITFNDCTFHDHSLINLDLKRLAVSPFAHLQRLEVSDYFGGSQDCLEFLMSNCNDVKYIDIITCRGITDETLSHILEKNKLKSLEVLKIIGGEIYMILDLSMRSVELLMTHCDQLHTIYGLHVWDGISPSELENFQAYIRSNNINLNT